MFGVTADFGSISSGTHRLEDLVPAYHSKLDDLREELTLQGDSHRELVEYVGVLDGFLASVERRMGEEDYYESEQAHRDLESLTEELEKFAPDYGYFGTNEGDGADFGFWFSQESFDQAVEDEELVKVEELPDQYDPEKSYAVVTDHGNVTLYQYNEEKGGLEEVWSIV